MADKKKFPNPEFFRAKTEMDWKAQAANLKEVGSIALELIKETDWKAFGKKQKDHFLDNMNRVARFTATDEVLLLYIAETNPISLCSHRSPRGDGKRLKEESIPLFVLFVLFGQAKRTLKDKYHNVTFSFLALLSDQKYQKSARRTRAVLLANHRAACTS